ncbi:MAG: cation transporter [Clostridiales bacterium]|nr:cation transporter [Clostridiales bacterium]
MMNDKKELFESVNPVKALAVMALPTVASQLILLIYNIADTWFIGRTNDPAMIGASNLALTVYLITVSLANIFGVGGGSLMVRLTGEKDPVEAQKVASYSIIASGITAIGFSLITLIFMTPLLTLLGADDMTMPYGKQYLFTTVVLGGFPTILSMSMPQLLRNAGYSKEAGLGVALGSILNVGLDPLFMFVILPKGNEVLGAGTATMLSNVCSFLYFVIIYRKVRNESVLKISFKHGKIAGEHLKSLYMVGVPAAVSIFLFDLVTIVINKLTVGYGDHIKPLAAMGIVLKLERIPINTGLGICLGMVPLIAYNFGSSDHERMNRFSVLARRSIIIFSMICMTAFFFFAEPLAAAFIKDAETVSYAAMFLKGRCLALPFMMISYHIVNYMNAVNKGKVSFLLAILRHVIILIPVMLIMNGLWGLTGLVWSQVVADVINAVVSMFIFVRIKNKIS